MLPHNMEKEFFKYFENWRRYKVFSIHTAVVQIEGNGTKRLKNRNISNCNISVSFWYLLIRLLSFFSILSPLPNPSYRFCGKKCYIPKVTPNQTPLHFFTFSCSRQSTTNFSSHNIWHVSTRNVQKEFTHSMKNTFFKYIENRRRYNFFSIYPESFNLTNIEHLAEK